MKTIIVIIVLVALGAVVFWSRGQGVFDQPRVKMIRMLTASDAQAVRVAKVIEQEVTADTQAAIYAAAQADFDIEHGNRSITLAWYLIDQVASRNPEHAYFDWKDGSETVVPAFDEMLEARGVRERPDMSLLLEHEQQYFAEFTSIPIILAHYAPIFERNGLSLMTLDAGWDSYYFFVTKKSTGTLWRNVEISEPDAKAHLRIGRILPFGQDIATVADPKEVFDSALNLDARTEVPWRSGH